MRSHNPPLATITRANYVIYLRRMLEELAWTEQLPALAHLLGRDDVPRKEHHLPRPLTPEQDQLIQQELLRRNDLASNVLLLLRHTGMRIGECVDLSFDCLRPLGPGSVGHPCAAWQAQNRTLGSRGLHGLSTGRTHPFSAAAHRRPEHGRLLIVRPRGRYSVDSQTPRCAARCRVGRRNYGSHRPAPVSTHLWN